MFKVKVNEASSPLPTSSVLNKLMLGDLCTFTLMYESAISQSVIWILLTLFLFLFATVDQEPQTTVIHNPPDGNKVLCI